MTVHALEFCGIISWSYMWANWKLCESCTMKYWCVWVRNNHHTFLFTVPHGVEIRAQIIICVRFLSQVLERGSEACTLFQLLPFIIDRSIIAGRGMFIYVSIRILTVADTINELNWWCGSMDTTKATFSMKSKVYSTKWLSDIRLS